MTSRWVIAALLAWVVLLAQPVMRIVPLAEAAVVSRIVVEGNQRVETESVLSYLQFSQGQNYDAEVADESVKALFQTGLFADVQIFQRGSTVVVRVVENPMINSVSFQGNDEIDSDDLAKELELRERMVYTRARVQNDIERMKALYRRSGFTGVVITPTTTPLPQNRVDLVYKIAEGGETRIGSIEFEGNNAFSDSDLRGVIASAEHRWWKFFASNDKYDPDRLEYDKELLRRYYLKNGFADIKIISADAQLEENGEDYRVLFTLEEGPLYRIRDVAVNKGDTNIEDDVLRRAVETNPGADYDASKVDKSIENITVEAGKKGFAFAKVEPDLQRDEPNQQLDIVYNIQEGPRTYIERIDITGNDRTLDEVIRRELRLFEGDAYNRILVDRARRRLVALDFFEKVDIREEEGSAPDKVVLVIDVVEKSTGSISFSAGYSTTETIVGGITLTERNLLGRGQTVKIDTQLSFKKQSGSFSFTEPYFLDMPLSAGFDLYATRSDNSSISSYESTQYGGALRTGFRLDEYQSLLFRYTILRREITDIDPGASFAVLDAAGVTWKSSIGATYTYDDLDNPVNPTKGFRGQIRTELAGLGGDVYFIGTEASGWWFRPIITDGIVLKLEGNVGNQFAYTNDDVPILDRYFKGGDSLRGFERSGIGPRVLDPVTGDTDAIGGQTYAIGTAEVTFPLGLPEEFGLKGAVFTDFGTLFNAPEDTLAAGTGNCPGAPNVAPCTVFDTVAFRASVGAGVVWQSPFGPLRFDLAYPFAKAKYDQEEWFRFSIGTSF
jgi:outer membrane protein insertion porin family